MKSAIAGRYLLFLCPLKVCSLKYVPACSDMRPGRATWEQHESSCVSCAMTVLLKSSSADSLACVISFSGCFSSESRMCHWESKGNRTTLKPSNSPWPSLPVDPQDVLCPAAIRKPRQWPGNGICALALSLSVQHQRLVMSCHKSVKVCTWQNKVADRDYKCPYSHPDKV